ncbi:MAG TPA: Stk1 family PASTA domain-containing Ser/Thr kinase [Streptosporangiaceae bacterium]|nr:Stk1 family PASTA domain-containing Ser/Thr kinase [Streptosporangiaceae bacterium]
MTQPRLLGGRYELDGIVGRGGMAEVFRARDIRLDRIVGVKTLRDDLARDQTFQARFRREAQSAASLNHPSIVAVYDTGEDMVGNTPVPYIVMEFVDGRTLRDLLRDDRRLLPDRAAEITDGVLRALDYSHRNGIVHRDIKPGNVMLTRSGDVKVMDFGIARAVSDAQATMTQTAQVIGTAQYLSPEQARGERVDARSDLYSAGCLLYELLTGRPPFTGDSPVAIAYQHVREAPVPPSRIDPELPAWCDAIVLKAMEKDPADRYQSAGEMRNDIQRALSGAPVAASMHHTEMYNTGTRRMGQSTQLAGSTSAIPPYQYGPEAGQGRGGDYGGEPPRRRAWPWVLVGAIVLLLVAGGIFAFEFASSNGGSISVPAVTGLPANQAKAEIVKANLVVGTVTNRPSATVPSGNVISSNPSDGTNVKAHTSVNLVVSAGQAKKTVPSVTGMQEQAAITELTSAGLNYNVKQVQSSQPQNTVVSQSPPAGSKVAPSTIVTLNVSEGGTSVPNVIGQTQAQATQELQSKGFTVRPVVSSNAPAGTPPGTVFSMSPGPGTNAQSGATITINVAAAAPTTSPPPDTTSPPTDTTSPPDGGLTSPPTLP